MRAASGKMLVSVYETLRSAGLELTLEPGARASLDDAIEDLLRELEQLLADPKATETQREAAVDTLDLLQTTRLPERLHRAPDLDRPRCPRGCIQ